MRRWSWLCGALLAWSATSAMAQAPGGWQPVGTPGPVEFGRGGFTTDGTSLYHFGGQGSGALTSLTAARLDLSTGQWSTLGALPQQVTANRGECLNGTLYSFGSLSYPPTPGQPPNVDDPIFKYQLSTSGWMPVTSHIPQHGSDLASAVFGSRVFLFGGRSNQSQRQVDAVSEFDPVTEVVTPRNPMPLVLFGHAAVPVPRLGKIFILGGYSRDATDAGVMSDQTLQYEPATDTWTIKAPLVVNGTPEQRLGATAFELGGKVYLVGGLRRSGGAFVPTTTTLVFDPIANSWDYGPPLNVPRRWPGSAVVGGRAFVYGGDVPSGDGGASVPLEILSLLDAGAGWNGFEGGGSDAGDADAGDADAGAVDVGVFDAGAADPDAGDLDAGHEDAGDDLDAGDAGGAVADAGHDGGMASADAGAGGGRDAGGQADGGGSPGKSATGCGCSSGDALTPVLALVGALAQRRRRRDGGSRDAHAAR
jgi:MYXO-CTERM domain-containing protein